MKIRGFEVVRDDMRKTTGEVRMPERATSGSMAYDFFANDDYIVKPGEIAKVWTDIKAYMQHGEGFFINIRSSMSGKFILSTVQGWIDEDYYGCKKNDGNIGFFLLNISDETQHIARGTAIGQGLFSNILFADNDNATGVRVGGFGSTNE